MILKPCNRLCVEPPTPRPQCFNARVSKGDFGGLIILSFGAKAPQFTLTLNFGGGWVVLDGKGLNNSSIYGVCVCVQRSLHHYQQVSVNCDHDDYVYSMYNYIIMIVPVKTALK